MASRSESSRIVCSLHLFVLCGPYCAALGSKGSHKHAGDVVFSDDTVVAAGRTDAEEWSHQIKHEEHEVVLLPVEATKLFLDFRPYMNSAPLAVRSAVPVLAVPQVV